MPSTHRVLGSVLGREQFKLQPCWFYSVQLFISLSSKTHVIGPGNSSQRPASYQGRESRVRRWKVGK